MKRGLVGLIPLVFFLSLPSVFAAETILDLLTGTSDSSIIFLKLLYALLIFIIFLKVSKETIFKKEQQKLGNMFSLLLAFFAFRFTPNTVVEGFGWVLMFITPFIIFWTLYGVFVKKQEGKFSWLRFILALVSTFIVFIALGSTSAFGIGLGSTPYAGGFLDETFSDLHYLIFYQLNTFFVLLLAGIVIGLLFMLISRLPGVQGESGGTFGNSWLRGFLWMLLIIIILALLGWLFGGGLTAISIPLGWLGYLITYGFWLLVILGILFLLWLLFKYPAFRQVVWRAIQFLFWRVPRWIVLGLWWLLQRLGRGLWWLLQRIGRGLVYIFGGIGSWIANRWRAWRGRPRAALERELVVELRAGPQNVGDIAQIGGRRITVMPGSTTPLVFDLYRRRRFWLFGRRNAGRVRLNGATITVVRVNNGTITPANGTADARGRFTATYAAPAVAGNARMHLEITHPDIDPTQIIPDRDIQIGVAENLTITVPAIAPINTDDTADVTIEVVDAAGNGVNGVNVTVTFPRIVGSVPLTGTTTAGGPGTPSLIVLRTAVFPTAGTFGFSVAVIAPQGYNAVAPIPGVITVHNATLPTLEIINVQGRVGPTVVNGTPAIPVRIGQRVDVSLNVRIAAAAGGAPGANIDTATITIIPLTGFTVPTNRGGGRYQGILNLVGLTPAEVTALIGPQRFVITATLARHNPSTAYLDIIIDDLPELSVGIVPPVSPMRIGMTENIEIEVNQTVSAGIVSPPVDAQVEVLLNRNPFFTQRTGRPAMGELLVPFSPTTAGAYVFTVHVHEAGYRDPPDQRFTVTVLPLSDIDIDIEVLDTTGMLITGVIAVGQIVDITVFARERGTGTILTTGTVGLTPARQANTTLITPSGPLLARGHTARFSASAPGAYVYGINVAIPGFNILRVPPTVTLNVALPTMNVLVDPVRSPLGVGDSASINLTVTNTIGGVLRGASVAVRNHTGVALPGLVVPRLVTPGPGNTFSGNFTPTPATPAGRYQLDIEVTVPGYAPWTGNVQVEILNTPHMNVTVNWVPEPTTSNRYMLMNFMVIDAITGNPVDGAVIQVRDLDAPGLFFDRAGPYTTNRFGQLGTELHISLGRVLAAGGTERHRIRIQVAHAGHIPTENVDASGAGTTAVVLTFHPPRSRLGGPQSRNF